MSDRTTRKAEGREWVTSGSRTCPSEDLCDKGKRETYEEYVRRHCVDHNLGEFGKLFDAERNLGVWCAFYSHKYVWVNPELHPRPHWEIHSFISEPAWNEQDLQHRIPLSKRKEKHYLPDAWHRRPGEARRFKQVEVPRQCQKTSIGARFFPVFEALHQYFILDNRSYRQIVRSATGKNTRDTLQIIRRMSSRSAKITELYGIFVVQCKRCGARQQSAARIAGSCKEKVTTSKVKRACGGMLTHRRICLVNDSHGTGSSGKDQISFRWLTDAPDANATAAYSIWVAGLGTETTGQRPDRYIWDDPQTEKNSDTLEKREKIHRQFDESVRELQFSGTLLVLDTRKYVSDFAGKIGEEPLVSLFHSLRREVRWKTDEPDNAPWVVNGFRYYYPLKGDGQPALDEGAVKKLMAQMIGRTYSAEYMNDPLGESSAKFKREHFPIIDHLDPKLVPPEVMYGLGRDVSPDEQLELDHLGVRIFAINGCDPAGDAKQRKTNDDCFISAVRLDRYGRIFITRLAAGRWGAQKMWDEVDKASTYNRAQFTDYEMPASELTVQDSLDKWIRARSESLSAVNAAPVVVRMPILFTSMPKSTKDSRMDQMELFLPVYILDNAADEALIEKYISQWIGRGVEDHDDGPDSTSRLIPYFSVNRYKQPAEAEAGAQIEVTADGDAHVPLELIKKMGGMRQTGGLWGQQGGMGARPCNHCGRVNCVEAHVA